MKIWQLILIISAIWLLSEIILAIVKRSKSSSATSKDKSSLRFLWIVIVISLVAGIYLGRGRVGYIESLNNWLTYAGLILIVAGLVVRWIAILTLKKFFTVNVAINNEHGIIQNGIYGHIRHPSYTGSLFSFLGLGLAFSSYISLIVIVIPITVVFLYRVKIEEAVLTEAFGNQYSDYCSRTKRFLPYIY